MIRLLKKLCLSEKGATAVEYGLIVALIAVAISVAVSNFAGTTINIWSHVANEVTENS